MLKARVYHYFIPRNIQELTDKIREEIALVANEELYRSVQNLLTRCELVIEHNGSHIQQFL